MRDYNYELGPQFRITSDVLKKYFSMSYVDTNPTIAFYGNVGNKVGEFRYIDGAWSFSGNAIESAKLFVDLVLKEFNDRGDL